MPISKIDRDIKIAENQKKSSVVMKDYPHHSCRLVIQEDSYVHQAAIKTSFKAKYTDLRDLPGLPCALCGKEMIPNDFYRKFSPGQNEPQAQKVFQMLEPYEKEMYGHYKDVYNTLKTYASCNPNKTIREILNSHSIRKKHLKSLETKQTKVLEDVNIIMDKLSKSTRSKAKPLIQDARKALFTPGTEHNKKRKDIIDIFVQMHVKEREESIKREILETIIKLPSSSNDVDAFFVKYSRRSSNETVQNMIQKFTATIEHVLPKNNLNGEKGANSIKNYVVMHQGCNNERSQIPYEVMIEKYPDIPKNMQKHMDKITEHYKANMLTSEYDNYADDIKETLYKESNGKININTSGYVKAAATPSAKEQKLGFKKRQTHAAGIPIELQKTKDKQNEILNQPMLNIKYFLLAQFFKNQHNRNVHEDCTRKETSWQNMYF